MRLGQHLYSGDLLDEIDASLPEQYYLFDEQIWKMFYKYPDVLSKDSEPPGLLLSGGSTRLRYLHALGPYARFARSTQRFRNCLPRPPWACGAAVQHPLRIKIIAPVLAS